MSHPAGSVRVLHVDDEPDFAELAAEFLEREDDRFTIDTATSAAEALELLSAEDYDCIVSDYDMPGRNGIDFLEEVREDDPDLPFLLFTGKGSEEIASEAISAGVSDYLQKHGGTDRYTLLANRIINAVSARRSAEDAERRRHRLEQILKTVPACVVEIDYDGQFVFANDRAKEVLGLEREAVTDRTYNDPEWNIRDLEGNPIPDDELPFRQVRDSGEPVYGYRHSIEWPDGTRKVLLVSGAPLFDDDGTVDSTVFALTDITERRERIEKLDQIKRNVSEVIWISTPEKESMEFISDAYEDVWGRSTDSLREDPTSFVDTIHPDDRDRVEHALQSQADAPDDYDEVYRIVRPDGEVRWVHDRSTGVYEQGELTRIIGIASDITERKQRERELARTNAQLEAAIDAGAIATWEWHVQEDRLVAGPAFAKLFGVDPEAAREGVSIERFLPAVHDDDRDHVETKIDAALEACDEYEAEYRVRTAEDGLRWVMARGKVECDADGTPRRFPGVTIDITDRKEAEQALEEQNERLDEFASIVSHDLRSPLNVAEGRLALAREDHDNEHLEAVSQAHDRMNALIDDLLVLSRDEEPLEDTTIDLRVLTEGCWDYVVTNEAMLEVAIDDTITGDERRLRQLFENLFRNAVEHAAPAVTVTIGPLEDGFYVEDDGPGIPPKDREAVFESGYSTSSDGTGYGLRIVESIAETHGWSLSLIESSTGGARFEFTDVDRPD